MGRGNCTHTATLFKLIATRVGNPKSAFHSIFGPILDQESAIQIKDSDCCFITVVALKKNIYLKCGGQKPKDT